MHIIRLFICRFWREITCNGRRSVNCEYDPLCDCSCQPGTLHFRALLVGERFTPSGTRAGVLCMKQKGVPAIPRCRDKSLWNLALRLTTKLHVSVPRLRRITSCSRAGQHTFDHAAGLWNVLALRHLRQFVFCGTRRLTFPACRFRTGSSCRVRAY